MRHRGRSTALRYTTEGIDVVRLKNFGEPQWDEAEYGRYLDVERHMFAWCLVQFGGVDPTAASVRAEQRYPFEVPGTRNRGIIFHDLAWHYAMLELHGNMYWKARPDLERAPAEYEAEC